MSKRLKTYALLIAIPVGLGMALASCNHSSPTDVPPPTEFAQPVIQPLKFGKAKKIDWSAVKAVKVASVVTKLNWDKLPVQPYDTAGFKPFRYPVEETKFDYNSLPSKDLDIEKLSSHPLKFKTYILPPPKLIKGAKLLFKNGNLLNFRFGVDQTTEGIVVFHLLNDRDGFLWMATGQGIYRYDGENLLLYVPDTFTKTFVWDMMQDNQGNIWYNSYDDGVAEIVPKHGILKRLGANQGTDHLSTHQFMQDKQERIWLTSKDGIVIIDTKTQTIKKLDKAHGLIADTCWGITKDKDDKVWISSWNGGVGIIDLKNKKISYLDKMYGLKTNETGGLICDNMGRVWVELRGGVFNIVDVRNNTIETIRGAQLHGQDLARNLLIDKHGRLWMGSFADGLEIIDPEKRLVMNLKKTTGLFSNNVIDIKQDNKGQVWIATVDGLNIFGDNKTMVDHIGEEIVNSLTEDRQGLIWDATVFNGINILDLKNGTSRLLGTKQGLLNDSTNTISDINNRIFIVTNGGLDIVDSLRSTITHLGTKQVFNNKTITLVEADRAGRLWVGLSDGVDVYDLKNQTIKHLGKDQGLVDGQVHDVCFDQKGWIWINTPLGVGVIDPDSWTVQYLENVKGLKNVDVLLPDNKGNIWMGTDKGIYIVDRGHKSLISFSTSQGLVNDGLSSLSIRNGCVYAGTNGGITAITPPANGLFSNRKWKAESFRINKFTEYDQTDLVTRDGLYLWGDSGITVLNLSKKDDFKSTPYISGISVNDHSMYFLDTTKVKTSQKDTLWDQNGEGYFLNGEMPLNNGYTGQIGLKWNKVTGPDNIPTDLQLPYNQNNIRFSYSNLNLSPHETTSYRYKLIGADKKWSDVTDETSTADYTNLQAGRYTFEVTSRNADNTWNMPATLSFIVTPPWWRTWWAYVLYLFLLAGLIWCFRSIQLVNEKRVLEHKVLLRTQEVMQQKEEIEAQRDDLDKAFKELKAAQNQLIQTEKMASLGELTAGIAHEIQNPLNFVNNFSDVNAEMIGELEGELKAGNIDEALAIAADIKENEQKINHHGKRADSIVKGMLQHSRASSGAKDPTDINALADEYLRLAYHGLRAKDKSFNALTETHFDAGIGKLTINPQEIGRVILNLLNNAFYAVNEKKATHPEGYEPTVTITTKLFSPSLASAGRVITLSVRDNGGGIPQKILDKIYQPFFTTKPTGQGTGLGLSMSYDIIKAHGGELKVETKEGEFTEFTIQMPFKNDAA